MNAYFNYLVEANLVLLFSYLVFAVMLRHETDFTVKRLFLIGSLIAAISFPLLHFQLSSATLPTLSGLLPTYLLPMVEVTAGGAVVSGEAAAPPTLWTIFKYAYLTGAAISISIFITRLTRLWRMIKTANAASCGRFRIAESSLNVPSFSFFHYIFVGQSERLSHTEKEQIIKHEMAHARRWHSFDILVVQVAKILFWFNPIIQLYKKTIVQLHEFEADARATSKHDVNDYCSLLAKVALLSADIKLASHFNNSLTLKRINMMRTLKRNVRRWKLVTITLLVPLVFCFVACQDQVMTEVKNLAKTANMAVDIPEEVQARIDKIKNDNPDKKFVVIETTTDEGWKTLEKIQQNNVARIELITPTAKPSETIRSFAVVELNEMTGKIAEGTQQENDVYVVVDDTAMPEGGMPAFYEYVARKLKYPKSAREKGLEGKVFVEFVVQTDGSITDVAVSKGISEELNHAAMNVLEGSPRWVPGKVKGNPVKQRMVMPINFRL
jgi:TonB family protein